MFKSLKGLWVRVTCKHDYILKETVHGDRIIHLGYTRSIWVCSKCSKYHYSEYLDKL